MKTLARQEDALELLERVRALRPDSPRRWGRMSAHQMVCHLSDACCMATGDMTVNDVSTFATRTITKWTALHLPLRWPRGIATVAEIDQGKGGTAPGEFAADVATLGKRIYLHADHHLRQFGA
jgi:hypothetical protein